MKYLLLTLVLFYSCKGKEKHYEIDMITNSGSTQSGHIYHQGIKLSPGGYTARYQFIRPNQGKWDTTIFYFIERDGKAQPPDQFFPKSELDDTSGYTHFVQDTAGQRAKTRYYVDSIEAILTDGAIFGPVTYGFKRVHHKKKPIHNIEFAPAGTKAVNLPYFQVLASREFAQIADSTGIVATRDSSGHWDIKDPARALEIMYKIVWKKDR